MREKIYVDRLFADYEDSPEIADFKEEIAANLSERVRDITATGLDEENAFEKAAAELGDITAIADEVGKKNRNAAIAQMYMKARVPVTKKTAAGLAAASGLLLISAGIVLVAFFGETSGTGFYYTSAALLSAACGLYTYFGLTRETASNYAMKRGRALAYGAACLAGVLGVGLATVSFLFAGVELFASVAIKAVFIIPAICVLIFLLVTQPKRQKPWLKAMIERDIENYMQSCPDQVSMVNPVKAARFGVASGGLWLLAIAVFVTLGFIIPWQYAALTFLFALPVQVFMVMAIFEKKQ